MGRSGWLVLTGALFVLLLGIAGVPDPVRADPAGTAPDSAQNAGGSKWFPIPFVFYQPETRWGGGIGILHTYRSAAESRVSSNALLLLYTQEKQYSAAVKAEHYARENRWRATVELEGSRFPGSFFGVGNETRDRDEESVTLDRRGALLDLRGLVTAHVYAGAAVGGQNCAARDLEPGGLVTTLDLPGRGRGNLVFAGPVFSIDSRDRVYSPAGGGLLGVSLRRYDAALGSDWTFTRIDLDARRYHTLPGGMVLAVQALATVSSNEPRPFYDLATLGGANVLRGIYEGRYRDRNRAVAQAELRIPILSRVDGEIFLSAGEVAERLPDLRLDRFHAGGGAGLLFLISEKDGTRLRIDFGFARNESGVYFAFGEAF